MLDFLMENFATIIISAIVIVMVAIIIIRMISDKKKGKSSCGCKCGCCPNASLCHSNPTDNKQN